MNISDLRDGMRRVDVEADVVSAEPSREVKTRDGLKTVYDFILNDGTGDIKMTLWDDDQGVSKGSRIRISNGYTSSYRGQLAVAAGKYGRLEVIGQAQPQSAKTQQKLRTFQDGDAQVSPFTPEQEARIVQIVSEQLYGKAGD